MSLTITSLCDSPMSSNLTPFSVSMSQDAGAPFHLKAPFFTIACCLLENPSQSQETMVHSLTAAVYSNTAKSSQQDGSAGKDSCYHAQWPEVLSTLGTQLSKLSSDFSLHILVNSHKSTYTDRDTHK